MNRRLFTALFITMSTVSYADSILPIDHDVNISDVIAEAKSTSMPVIGKRFNSQDRFKLFDTNSDGKITFEELYTGEELIKKKRSEKELNEMMQSCDKNKDGLIVEDELLDEEALMKTMQSFDFAGDPMSIPKQCMFPKDAFDFMDENGDGSVTREEILATILSGRRPSKKTENKHLKSRLKAEAKQRAKEFSNCDTDTDQLLTLREAFSMKCSLHLFTEQFDAYDTNLDSYLSLEEIKAEVKPVHFRPKPTVEAIAAREKLPPLVRLETSMFECDTDEDGRLAKNETITKNCEVELSFFDRVDSDQDGYISLNEIDQMRMKKRFDRMDKDKDGALDKNEFKRY